MRPEHDDESARGLGCALLALGGSLALVALFWYLVFVG